MEKIGNHCFSTPKCGISWADLHFKKFSQPNAKNYKFAIVRNPYHRMVSYYVNKIVFQGDPPWALKDSYSEEPTIDVHSQFSTDISFEEFCILLENVKVKQAERHLRPQSVKYNPRNINKIVKLETFAQDMVEVCKVLLVDYTTLMNTKKENHFPRTDDVQYYIGDQKPWFLRENGIPRDYRLFYNRRSRDIIYNKYNSDFESFSYDKNDIGKS